MKMDSIIEILKPQLPILATLYAIVLVLVALDLWSGVGKARQRGEFRTSVGLRRTVDKVNKYYNMLFTITAIDTAQMLAINQLNIQGSSYPIIPILTFVGVMFVGIIEVKSIYERAEDKDKEEINEAARIAMQILKNRDLKAIIEKMDSETEKEKDNEEIL